MHHHENPLISLHIISNTKSVRNIVGKSLLYILTTIEHFQFFSLAVFVETKALQKFSTAQKKVPLWNFHSISFPPENIKH